MDPWPWPLKTCCPSCLGLHKEKAFLFLFLPVCLLNFTYFRKLFQKIEEKNQKLQLAHSPPLKNNLKIFCVCECHSRGSPNLYAEEQIPGNNYVKLHFNRQLF